MTENQSEEIPELSCDAELPRDLSDTNAKFPRDLSDKNTELTRDLSDTNVETEPMMSKPDECAQKNKSSLKKTEGSISSLETWPCECEKTEHFLTTKQVSFLGQQTKKRKRTKKEPKFSEDDYFSSGFRSGREPLRERNTSSSKKWKSEKLVESWFVPKPGMFLNF